MVEDVRVTPPTGETWLSIREASQLLGVSSSTLRRWSNRKLVAVSVTPGGHRRYTRASIEELQQQLAVRSVVWATDHAHAFPLREWQIPSEQLRAQRWYAPFASPETAKEMRTMGQRLLGLLIQYVTRLNDDVRFLHEAREVGTIYGAFAVRSGASLQESIEAFLFFRKSFSQTALQVPRVTHSSDADEIIRFTHRVHEFMDAVLAGMTTGYESGWISQRRTGDDSSPTSKE